MFFVDDDFQPIRSHNVSKSLIDTFLSVLAKEVLQKIYLFRPEKAKSLEKEILSFLRKISVYAIQETNFLPSETEDFEQLKRLTYTVKSEEETKTWLADLAILPQINVVVSYDFNTAFLMPWSIFMLHYDDFCYYGGYDICICSVDEQWYLLYYHEDVFLFGRRRLEMQV